MICTFHCHPATDPRHRASRLQCLGLFVAGVTVLAFWNPLTHPGPVCCLMRRGVGLPCPLCGATRGAALCLRGHPLEASAYNPLVLPLGVVALYLACKWAVEVARGVRIEINWHPALARLAPWLLHLTVFSSWAYLLVYRREDDFAASWLGGLWRTFFS
jgi:hypothetical protein